MATVELTTEYAREAEHPGFFPRVRALATTLLQRQVERRIVAKLARMSPRRLEDMGFDPAAVYGAVEGTWDEVDPSRFYNP